MDTFDKRMLFTFVISFLVLIFIGLSYANGILFALNIMGSFMVLILLLIGIVLFIYWLSTKIFKEEKHHYGRGG